jgi:MFS family permease
MWEPYLKLPRAVYILCIGTLINRAGTLLFPFLTLYLNEEIGTSKAFATRAIAVYGIGAMGAVLTGGHLADVVGRRVIMLVATFGSAGLLMLLSFLTQAWSIVAFLFVFGFVAEMYRPASSAMIADLVPTEQRKAAYSLQYVAVNLGFAIAPLVGGYIVEYHTYNLLFWGDALTTLCLALIILVGIRETLHLAHDEASTLDAEAATASTAGQPGRGFASVLRDRPFMVFCGGTLLLAMIYMQAMSTLPLYLRGLGISKATYGQIMMVNGAMIALLQLPLTVFVARFDRANMIALAALITGIGFGLTGWALTPLHVVGTLIIWTLGEMISAALVQPIVSDLAPPRLRARYMGMLTFCFAGGNVIGVPLGGEVLERFGGPSLWNLTIAAGALAALLFVVIRGHIRDLPVDRAPASPP